MTDEERKRLQEIVRGSDVSEVMAVVMNGGNRYSRRILRFFRWFCKWVPAGVMCFHAAAMLDFRENGYDMFEPYLDNWLSYAFTYFMLYVLPMVIILASRFFFLCWKYRVPFFYFFGVNAIHIAYGSWYTTNEMAAAHVCLMVMIAGFYFYGLLDWWFSGKRRYGTDGAYKADGTNGTDRADTGKNND